MAAWTARIDGITDNRNGGDMSVTVSYYDATDTTFQTLLYAYTFTATSGTTQADLVSQIVEMGQAERAAQQRVSAAQSKVGTTINVP